MIGNTISHYRIVEKLGEGGMGVVYRAHDEQLDRDVALKVLSAGALADESARMRFRREALVLSQLNHPNIAVVHAFDTQDGVDFLAMELVPGVTLAQKLAAGALPEKEAIALGMQIADALEEAHERNIVHRDLKPGNVMVTAKGRVKVLDFGLARLVPPTELEAATTAGSAETQAGMLVGTMPYMAPEQLQGQRADARSDVWALGSVLYEMATARRPFPEKEPTQLVAAILTHPAQPPRELNSRVSPGLESIILKALEKDPSRRGSAKELRENLEHLSTTGHVAALGPWHRYALASAAGLAVLLAILVGLNVDKLRDRLQGRSRPLHIESIAVLPLENLSHDLEQEYFADGVTEELITDMAKISALKVISRTSVMPYKNTKKSVREIAGELKADALIDGSVRRSADRVRVTVELIEASSNQPLWTESYERDFRNILAMQGEVAQAIARQVRAVITPQEQARLIRNSPVDPEVYERYLKGRHIMMRGDLEDVRKAIEYFQSGLAKDPNNALIYTGLADAYIQQMSDVHESAAEATAKSRAATTKALELDESLAEAHSSLAMIKFAYDWDWAGAERELKRALELNPGYSLAYVRYGVYLTAVGRHIDGLPYFEKAQRLDPIDPWAYAGVAYSYFMARKYGEAIEQYRKGLEIEPDPMMYFGLVLALAQKGDHATAVSEAEKASRLNDSPLLLTGLASAYAMAGRRADSTRILRQLEEISRHQGPAPPWHGRKPTSYVCPYEVAGVYAQLGNKDLAFEWLDRAYQVRSCMYWFRQDPRLDSLRSDPRFQDLLRRMNFPPSPS
ncbi:MAG TPA: protein kinase [Acidobacteriota bacterium]|nr:protein kinase [Acidobacteriota bacterium]